MSSDGWKTFKLEEVAEIVGGGTPSTDNSDYWGGEIPWLTPRDLSTNEDRFVSHGERNITKLGLENSSAKLLPAGTILLTTRAPIGYLAIASNPICTNQGFKSLIPNYQLVDGLFLYYLLRNNVEYLKSVGVGTTFAEISGGVLRRIEFDFPDLPIQRQIAEILSALDDKIELNRQTNATLEAIAQAIFKEWFVDFNYPGATGEMVESELGPIPKGWSVDNLRGFASVSSGKGLKRTEFTDEGYPILGANGQIGFTNNYLIDDEVILTGRVGTLGTLQLINKKAWISDNVLIITPKEDFYYHYLYLWLKTVDFQNLNRGSTQPLITKTDLLRLSILQPDVNILIKYDRICRGLFNIITKYNNENALLSKIRDHLLPKLMNEQAELCCKFL